MSETTKRWFLSLLLFSCAAARPPNGPRAVEPGMATFDSRSAASFGDATAPLAFLLSELVPRPTVPQSFCAVGYRSREGWEQVWVHWPAGNQLILWEGRGEPGYPDGSIARSRRRLDLTKDVVPTEADIAGSTYLVTRSWADAVIADCEASGVRYRISAVAPP